MKKRKHGQQTIPQTRNKERRGIVVDQNRWNAVRRNAARRGISASAFVRLGIDLKLEEVSP